MSTSRQVAGTCEHSLQRRGCESIASRKRCGTVAAPWRPAPSARGARRPLPICRQGRSPEDDDPFTLAHGTGDAFSCRDHPGNRGGVRPVANERRRQERAGLLRGRHASCHKDPCGHVGEPESRREFADDPSSGLETAHSPLVLRVMAPFYLPGRTRIAHRPRPDSPRAVEARYDALAASFSYFFLSAGSGAPFLPMA